MPGDSQKAHQFEPLHAAHAIEQVVFAVQFAGQMNDAGLQALMKAQEPFAAEFPRRAEVRGVLFQVGPGAGPMPPPALSGYAYQRFRTDGLVEAELRLERGAIVFQTPVYTRWAEVWGRVRAYFLRFLPIYLQDIQVSAVGLNYIDKFIWTGPLEEARPTAILRKDSQYLADHVFASEDLWHCHTGKFVRVDPATKRLLNVNVDYLDENRPEGLRKVLAVGTVITDMFNQFGYKQSIFSAGTAIDVIDVHFEEMHSFDKSTLRDIISVEMCRRIALGD